MIYLFLNAFSLQTTVQMTLVANYLHNGKKTRSMVDVYVYLGVIYFIL